MSRTESAMVELGTAAPDFQLTNVSTGETMGLTDVLGTSARSGLLIMFVCVHCPYVKHVEEELARIGRDYYGDSGSGPIAIAAIQSNDIAEYPEDGPDNMRDQVARLGWQFPYLLDSSQDVARSYGAACTPDFFVFDSNLRLAYRGQLDSSRPRRKDFGNDEPVTGKDLRAALDALISGHKPDPHQVSSIGCNIKWREVL